MSTEPPTEQLGVEGEACTACGSPLATDQRYCLNCGTARTGPRLDFSKHLVPPGPAVAAAGGPQPAVAGAAATGAPVAGQQPINPVTALFAIALLGVMLLLGVLIGKDDDGGQQTVAAATTTATAPTTTAPVDTAAAPAKDKSKKGGGDTPGAGAVETGGSGDTTGVAAADTAASPQDALKGPDVVATGGEQEALDPGGPVGGGSPSTCIGC